MRSKLTRMFLILLLARAALAASASEFVSAAYRPDIVFPQFLHLWSEGWALKDKNSDALQYATSNMPLGAYVHVYIRNVTAETLSINDVIFEGISLTEAIAFGDTQTSELYPASIRFSKLPKADLDRLYEAGEPVWWKVDPPSLPPGGFGEVTIRLRRQVRSPLTVQLLAKETAWRARVSVVPMPRFTGISFGPSLDIAYCYVQNPLQRNSGPVRLLLDGVDVTSRSSIGIDPAVDVTPIVIQLEKPLARGSFHCFQAIYSDGSCAIAGIRAWGEDLVYGMWGYINKGKTPQERVSYYLNDLQRHNVNAVMQSYGPEVGDFFSGTAGLDHSRETGIRAMRSKPGPVLNPVYYFLSDEPDAHDYAVSQLQPEQRLGSLGQDLVRRSYSFRQQDPAVPHLLNLDNTFKPENWYMYAQLPDVCSADPYYQEQQNIVWNERPIWASSFIRPTYVLGAATICNSACAPKPLHIILNSVRHETKRTPFRFATPAEKTVELFYALGAGAKSFSYWWYTPYGEFRGCGAEDKEAVALWGQIGLLGGQVRTAGPVLTRSCPGSVPLQASAKLWTRTLLAGTDALVLLVVNENIANDRLGTVVVPLKHTLVTVTPPSWLKTVDVFEITPEGLRDVNWKMNGAQAVLDLGETEVARMVLLAASNRLRSQLDGLYRSRFATNAAHLASSIQNGRLP